MVVWLSVRQYAVTARHKQRWIVCRAERTVGELVYSGGAYRALAPGRSIPPHPDWRFVVEQL